MAHLCLVAWGGRERVKVWTAEKVTTTCVVCVTIDGRLASILVSRIVELACFFVVLCGSSVSQKRGTRELLVV